MASNMSLNMNVNIPTHFAGVPPMVSTVEVWRAFAPVS